MAASDELTNFFQFLWNDTKGLVYLPTRDDQNNWRQFFFQWPNDLPKLVHNVQLWSAEGKEVFVSPAIYKESAIESCRQAKASGTDWAARKDVLGSHVLYADWDSDRGTPAPAEWPTEPTGDLPTPSLRIRSSMPGNQHAYWKLDNFETDIEAFETKNRSLTYLLDADKSGWHAAKILRPPGTVNHGYGKPEREGKTYEVLTEDTTEHTYHLDFFDPRPISGGMSVETLNPPKYQTYLKYSQAITSAPSSESDCLSLQVTSLSVAGQTTLWQLDTWVQRRALMIRLFTLSFCTLTIGSANTPIAETDITGYATLSNVPGVSIHTAPTI